MVGPGKNNVLMKAANTAVIVAKTVVTVDYLTAKLKLRSLLNCEIQSLRLAVKIKGAVISTFSLFS